MRLDRVWREHQSALRALARKVTWDKDSVDDVLQEAFLRILKSKRKFSSPKEIYHYARKTVVSAAIDAYRCARREREHVAPTPFIDAIAGLRREEFSPLDSLVREERADAYGTVTAHLRQALENLPPKQREAIDFFFRRRGEKKIRELCRDQGVPYSTLRSRMLDGIDRIRTQLREQGIDLLKLPEGYDDEL